MALTLLTIIAFLGGFIAILYSILALLSMLKFSRAQKTLPEKYEPDAGKPTTFGPPVAEAFCRRARILLQNRRFDAALADCKRAIDINPNHAEAHVLWELALEKELPAEPLAEPAVKAKPAIKKVKKVVTKIKRRKKVTAAPVAVEKPVAPVEEVPVVVAEAGLEKEIVPEEAAPTGEVTPTPEITIEAPEEVSPAPEPPSEEPVIAEKPVFELEAEPAEPTTELETEAEVELAVEPEKETIPEETTQEVELVLESEAAEVIGEPPPLPEEVAVEEIQAKAEPAIQLKTEADVKPTPKPAAEPEISEETGEEGAVSRKPLAGEEESPLIPEDQLVAKKPPGESLLEEFDHKKLGEFEAGEAGEGDKEWTRYADKEDRELAKSKIDMNDLPASAVGLKETLTDLRQAETYNLQGETHISKNLYNNAIKDFSRALEINPNYVDALINRGSAYAQLGRFNDALMDFNHALKFEKKDAELFSKRGEVYLQNNMHDQAIKDFTAAVVLNPMFSDAYLNRGRAYSEKGMPEEAMNDFNQAIKADSDHSFGFVDRAAPSLQIDENSRGNQEEAEKFNQQGLTALQNGKFAEALKDFTEAVNLVSSEAGGYINRGRTYIKLEKFDEAMADFNQAVLFDPLNASLYYWRAQAWKAKKDLFNMREDLKLSCEMGHEPACLEYRKLKSAKK